MTPLGQVRITEVWHALGGGDLRHGRGVAWWRAGDRYNVAVDDDKGVYYDFARGEGGGILDLIETVLDCDRKTAWAWLAQRYALPTRREHVSPRERRTYGARRRRADALAADLTTWRARLLQYLRRVRNAYWSGDRIVSAWAQDNLENPLLAEDPVWDEVWRHALDQQRGDEFEGVIKFIEMLTPSQLVVVRQELGDAQ